MIRPQYPQYRVVFLECRPGLLPTPATERVRNAGIFAADGQQALTHNLGRDHCRKPQPRRNPDFPVLILSVLIGCGT
jgi:hypothetical protein